MALLPWWHSCHVWLPFCIPCLLLLASMTLGAPLNCWRPKWATVLLLLASMMLCDIPSISGVPAALRACCCWRPWSYWHPFNCLRLSCAVCLLLLVSMMLPTSFRLLAFQAAVHECCCWRPWCIPSVAELYFCLRQCCCWNPCLFCHTCFLLVSLLLLPRQTGTQQVFHSERKNSFNFMHLRTKYNSLETVSAIKSAILSIFLKAIFSFFEEPVRLHGGVQP